MMPTDQLHHIRQAADIIAELLTQTVMQAERENRHLYIWERMGIAWLREQWKIDPGTSMNLWISSRYVDNIDMDLNAKMTTARIKP